MNALVHNPLRIAVLGAESTGKTTLAQSLQQHLSQAYGLRVAWVPEVLRQWCEQAGRTPLAHEQALIMRQQHQHIEVASALHQVVISDTTALMTAVYSQIVFGDTSLHEEAAALHSSMHCTLLTALDLPWVADGLQRDGPQVQAPVDDAIRALLTRSGVAFSVVSGAGQQRLQQTLAALQPWLGKQTADADPASTASGSKPGWLGAAGGQWSCECCSDGDAERALRRLQREQGSDQVR